MHGLRVARLAHELEGLHAEGIARHDGSRLAELLVRRGLATAVVVVVDAGQVVVDKAKGVEHLEGARREPDGIALAVEHVERSLRKARTQALSAGKHGIAHGLVQTARTVRHGREVFVKLCFRFLGNAGEIILRNGRFFFEIFHSPKILKKGRPNNGHALQISEKTD